MLCWVDGEEEGASATESGDGDEGEDDDNGSVDVTCAGWRGEGVTGSMVEREKILIFPPDTGTESF